MEFLIKLIGIWTGVFARMTVPFWRKVYKEKNVKFNAGYLKGTLASIVLSTIFIFLLFPKFELGSSAVANIEEGFKLFCLSFGFGFGFNSILIECGKWFSKE
jgi:hypothetical protein